MNTTTTAERNALTLPERAAVALGSTKTEVELRELVKQSADIVLVNNMAGRDQAHRIGMNLKNARVSIEKIGKEARDDANKFSAAVIAEEKRLKGIIAAEEDRVFGLRDGWDAKVEAERQAVIQAEAQRMADIAQQLECIRQREADVVRKCTTAAETQRMIDDLEYMAVVAGNFQERLPEAVALKASVLASMRVVLAERVAAEAAEAARVAAAKAEAERMEAQRIELARVAAEQAAEAARLEEVARVQRETAAADARALAAAQAERDRVAAQVKAQLEQQAAALAAERTAFEAVQRAAEKVKEDAAKLEADHAEGLVLNATFNATFTPPVAVLIPETPENDPDFQEVARPAPALRLGQITDRLGFNLTADFLLQLGFAASARDRAAMLYHEHEFPLICAALIRHVSAVQAKQAA